MRIQLKSTYLQVLAIVLWMPCLLYGQQRNIKMVKNHIGYSNYQSDFNRLNRNDIESEEKEYFDNHIYLQVWGHSVYSLNYFRFLQSPNLVVGGGVGVSFHVRNPPFTSTEGPIVNLFADKQFLIAKKFHYSMGIGGVYDFKGAYESFSDPFYLKAAINRYSISLEDDRLYYGLDLYYIKWEDWAIRPSIKLGISF